MKFINAEFFYNSTKLIDTNRSYWWILMGTLNNSNNGILEGTTTQNTSTLNSLKQKEQSYEIKSSTKVKLNNAFICGIAQALAPTIADGGTESKGTVELNASGSNGESKIPFTVGQENQLIGHDADSLWLLSLKSDLTMDEAILKLFPFTLDSTLGNTKAIQKYSGTPDLNFDLSDDKKCFPLIGYSVESSLAVNSINYSGFTVGNSVVTLSGLVSE